MYPILSGNEISTYNFQEEVAEGVAGQGNIPWKSWNERMNPRVSKEIVKGKVLPISSSNCFSFQSTKPEADESIRFLIGLSDFLGLEITEASIVLDVKSLPKMERKVRRHEATYT